jgi:hypothetical protein
MVEWIRATIPLARFSQSLLVPSKKTKVNRYLATHEGRRESTSRQPQLIGAGVGSTENSRVQKTGHFSVNIKLEISLVNFSS